MLGKRKFVLITSLLILFAVNICMSAPQNPGSALILYNSHRSLAADQRQFDHSISTMLVFRAALSGDRSFLQNPPEQLPFGPGLQGSDVIPPIDPPLRNVDVLDVRHRQGGIDADLRAWANTNLSGIERQIFDELYDAGNPLSYWSQVYDLRYIQEFWNEGAQNYTPLSVITTTGARSDLEYFRAFMRNGGGLYIQAADSAFVERNRSISTTVNALTRNNVNISNWGNANILIGTPRQGIFTEQADNFWFNNSDRADNFARGFNDLAALQQQYPMRWVRVGGVRHADLGHAIPLVSAGSETGRAVKVFWDSDGLQEEYRNGRLIISYGTTAFRDHEDGNGIYQTRQGWTRTTRTTLALIQNLYALMSEKTQRYTITKRFLEEERQVGEIGTVRISVRNPNNYPFELTGGITDDLASCLSYIPGSSRFAFIDFEGNATSATATEQHNGKRLHWIPNEPIPARSDWIIEFQYRVGSFDYNSGENEKSVFAQSQFDNGSGIRITKFEVNPTSITAGDVITANVSFEITLSPTGSGVNPCETLQDWTPNGGPNPWGGYNAGDLVQHNGNIYQAINTEPWNSEPSVGTPGTAQGNQRWTLIGPCQSPGGNERFFWTASLSRNSVWGSTGSMGINLTATTEPTATISTPVQLPAGSGTYIVERTLSFIVPDNDDWISNGQNWFLLVRYGGGTWGANQNPSSWVQVETDGKTLTISNNITFVENIARSSSRSSNTARLRIIGEIKPYEVIITYNLQHGGLTNTQSAMIQSLLPRPAENPTRTGYAFGGWFVDVNCVIPWNFETDIVRREMTLYAKWLPVLVQPVVKINGRLTSEQILDENNRVMIIEFDASQMPSELRQNEYLLKYRLKFQESISIANESGQFTIPAGSSEKLLFPVNLTDFLAIGTAMGENILRLTIVIENNGVPATDTINVNIALKEEFLTSITKPAKSNSRYGIRFAQNIVSEKAEISVVLPSNERAVETKIAIYDMTGNVVFSTTVRDNASWDLRNSAGRFVANGTYLVIVEVKGASGKVYAYSARLGVKR